MKAALGSEFPVANEGILDWVNQTRALLNFIVSPHSAQ